MTEKQKELPHKTLQELMEKSYKKDFHFKIGKLNFETPLKVFLDKIKENFDSLIFHKNLFEEGKKKELSIMLLKGKLVISPLIESNTPPSPIEIIEIKRFIDVELNASGNYFYVILRYIKEPSVDNLAELNLKFDNQKEAQIFKYFVEKEKINAWQLCFENESSIQDNFYYQYHFFLKKVNSHGDEENRVIVLTNEFILNIDYQIVAGKKTEFGQEFNFKFSKPKWAMSIKSFEELQLIEKDKKKKTNYHMIKIKVNQKENKAYVTDKKLPFKNKSSTDFIFQSDKLCRYFIFQIKRLYYNLNEKKYIKVTQC